MQQKSISFSHKLTGRLLNSPESTSTKRLSKPLGVACRAFLSSWPGVLRQLWCVRVRLNILLHSNLTHQPDVLAMQAESPSH